MRKKNSLVNIVTAFIEQFLNIILGFITRTVFIYILGKEYLGLNGLFTQLLMVLSLAELGFGTALNYSLYKPIAENNEKKISEIMEYYKKIYNNIGFFILIIGIILIPVLPLLIKFDEGVNVNYIAIYIFYLINTVLSYLLFAYKGAILNASQKQYLIKKESCIISLIISILQIIFLFITQNYYVYLFIMVMKNVFFNLIISKKVNKIFPFLKEKSKEKLSDIERYKIRKDVSSIAVYKVSDVMLTSTDSIMISSLIGITATGIYSNYAYIITTINTFVGLIFTSIIASVGNLTVTEKNEEKEKVFYKVFFLNIWIVGVSFICLWQLLSDFINLWIGEGYLLNKVTVFIIALNFLIKGLENTTYIFRVGGGVFQQSKYRPIFSIFINIFASVILVKYFGIAGVFLGTILSRLLTYFWIDPIVIYKQLFKKSSKNYFMMYLKGILNISICSVIVLFVNNNINGQSIMGFIVKCVCTFAIANILFIVLYKNDVNFKYFRNIILKKLT